MWLADQQAVSGTLVTSIVTGLVGLFGGGGLVALLRVNADKGKIVVEAAQGAVIVQTGVIDDLQEELARVKAELAEERRARAADQARHEREIAELRARLLRVENGGGPDAPWAG